jgi:hypothetical protein
MGLGCSSVVEHLLSMLEALDSVPHTAEKPNMLMILNGRIISD